MQCQIEQIGPTEAINLLTLNRNNRPLRESYVNRLASAMRNGQWMVNGESIKLAENRLIDGQHRLSAIVRSGVTIDTYVVRDAPEETFTTIDTGIVRTHGDILAIEGVPNYNTVATALKWIAMYEYGYIFTRVTHRGAPRRFTNSEILELMQNHPGIISSAQKSMVARRIAKPTLIAACHYLFAKHSELAADGFVDALAKGLGLSDDHPYYMLRERFIAQKAARAKLSDKYFFALCIKAWNLTVEGRTVQNLSWREAGAFPEAFPHVSALDSES
jgi:hypothetical protein